MMSVKTSSFLAVFAAVASCLVVTADARAGSTPDSFFDIFLDAGECRYRAIEQRDPTQFSDGIVETEILSMTLRQSDDPRETVTDLGGGQFRIESFFDIHTEISIDGGDPTTDSFFDIFTTIEYRPSAGRPTGTFDTEIVSMDLRGSHPGGNTPILQLSPSELHDGHVTILKGPTDPGEPDEFLIDSFFDIFLEMSLDGGNNFIPASSSTILTENAVHTVPEPSSAMLGALGMVAIGLIRRRRER